MIRREPTLIALSDSDVQDVKNFVEMRKAAAEKAKEVEMKDQAQASSSAAAPAAPAAVPAKKELTKEERLGLR